MMIMVQIEVSYILLISICTLTIIKGDNNEEHCLQEECDERTSGHNIWTKQQRCHDLTEFHVTLDTETQTWQQVPERNIMVFSAFVERREAADGPSLRIIGSGLQTAYNDIGDIYCQMWDKQSQETGPVVVQAKYIRIYPSTLHPDMWVSHFIICPLTDYQLSNALPVTVSITQEACSQPETFLMVLNDKCKEKSDSHALCLPPFHKPFSEWETLVEVFEMHFILGAKEITLYNQSMTETMRNVLFHYSNRTDTKVNVIQWHFPDDLKKFYYLQRGALNDCLYRMGNQHKYVIISDLDEVLVPRETSTWPELMEIIAKPERGAYLFQHAYFRRNNTGENPYLFTQQSLWRTNKVEPPGKIRCKAMYNSDHAISLDVHYAYQMTKGSQEYILPPSEGMLHHYRKTPMSTFAQNPENYQYLEDTYMTKYGVNLKGVFLKQVNKLRNKGII